jgi:lytic murein transglycosylase
MRRCPISVAVKPCIVPETKPTHREARRVSSQSFVRRAISLAACLAALLAIAAPARAQAPRPQGGDCGNDAAGFDAWLGRFRTYAASQGIRPDVIQAGLAGVTYDHKIISLDRGQKSFKLSFEEFYRRRVGEALLNRGRRLMAQHQALLQRVEKQYGVPASILVSIWGLETNYGSDSGGKMFIPRSLATLAYDCRRSDFFRKELLATLQIIQRGDMSAQQLVGGWAGEIGQVQFLPASYYKYAVDYDGDGRRDLVRSVPDMLASTANFLKAHGWQAGQGWQPGSNNFRVIAEWNKAEVYQKTIAVMADRLGQGGTAPPPAPQAKPRAAKGI